MTTDLTRVPTAALVALMRHVHRGSLECPLTPVSLALTGLQDASDHLMPALRGLDRRGVTAVIAAVLAERRRHSVGQSM